MNSGSSHQMPPARVNVASVLRPLLGLGWFGLFLDLFLFLPLFVALDHTRPLLFQFFVLVLDLLFALFAFRSPSASPMRL